jgi:glutamyl-tRNA reductase
MKLQVVPQEIEPATARGQDTAPAYPPVAIVSVTHHAAAVDVRESVALSPDAIPAVLRHLVGRDGVRGALVLSTCNRTEFFLTLAATAGAPLDAVAAALPDRMGTTLRRHARVHAGLDAIRHGLRVAAGLDSALVGEPHIVGQLREAHRISRAAGTLDAGLDLLVRELVARSRHIRNASGLSRRPDGLGALIVRHAERELGALRSRTAVVAGAGTMGALVATRLAPAVGRLILVSRTGASARELAARLDGNIDVATELAPAVDAADLVVCATDASTPILGAGQLAGRDRGRPLAVLDLGVPRNVDPAAADVPGVSLLDIDALGRLRAETAEAGVTGNVAAAEALARAEALALSSAMRERVLGSETIAQLTRWAEDVRRRQLTVALQRLPQLDDAAQAQLELMTQSLVRKLLDRPIRFMREHAEAPEILTVVGAALGVATEGSAE